MRNFIWALDIIFSSGFNQFCTTRVCLKSEGLREMQEEAAGARGQKEVEGGGKVVRWERSGWLQGGDGDGWAEACSWEWLWGAWRADTRPAGTKGKVPGACRYPKDRHEPCRQIIAVPWVAPRALLGGVLGPRAPFSRCQSGGKVATGPLGWHFGRFFGQADLTS